jgi:putative transposase
MTSTSIDQRIEKFLTDIFCGTRSNTPYSTMDFVHLLLDAVEHRDFVNNTSVRLGGPTGETVFARLKDASVETINDGFLAQLSLVLRLMSRLLRNREVALAFDTTDEPYYGRVKGLWVHPFCEAKGSTGCFKFLAVSAVDRRNRLVLGCLPVSVGADIVALVERLLLQARTVISPRLCLFDRGFDNCQLVERLQTLGVRYQILWRKPPWTTKELRKMRRGEIREVNRRGVYARDRTKHKVRLRFVLIKTYRRFANGKANHWVFCTNTRERWAHSYVDKYRQRWGIETVFRVLDNVQIKTTTKNIIIRHFLVSFCCLVYNLWKLSVLMDSQISLKNFTITILRLLPQFTMRPAKVPDD